MNRKVILGAVVVAVAAIAGFTLQRALHQRQSLVEQSAADAAVSATVARESNAGGRGKGDRPPEANLGTAGGTANNTAASADSPDEAIPKQRPIPATLPEVTLPDRNGAVRSLKDWKGRPLVVNFWATWCGPCREEIPLLKTLRHERTAERLEIIGIAIDQRDAVLKYAKDIGIDYPVLIGEKDGYAAAESFGVALVLPFSVFADSKGRIVTLKIGELHANEAAFILDRVRDIDTKKLELSAARQQIAEKMRELAIERGKQHADDDSPD